MSAGTRLREAKAISKFIKGWQKRNPYNKAKIVEYNMRFREDFTNFCEENKISAEERDFYLK